MRFVEKDIRLNPVRKMRGEFSCDVYDEVFRQVIREIERDVFWQIADMILVVHAFADDCKNNRRNYNVRAKSVTRENVL